MNYHLSRLWTSLCLFFIFCGAAAAQISISEAGEDPDASAILDVSSTEKGMLTPRMNTAERTAIASPADGLLVYDTDKGSFWFYENSQWNEISSGGATLSANTLIEEETTPDFSCLAEVGSFSEGNNLYRVEIQGDYAYIIDVTDKELLILDVSAPASPTLVSSLAFTNPHDVAVSGNYAFVVENISSNSFHVVDISDAANPAVDTTITINKLTEVVVSGNYAYGIDATDGELEILDISSPTSPTMMGSVSLGAFNRHLTIEGDYAYLVDVTGDKLIIVEVSDPANPIYMGDASTGDDVNGLAIAGNYAFLTEADAGVLEIYDVSDPANPTQAITKYVGPNPQEITIVGNYAFLVDIDGDFFKVLNISDVNNISTENTLTVGSFPNKVTVGNGYAYVLDLGTLDMKIIDLSCDAILGFNPLSGAFAQYPDPNTDDQTIDEFSLSGNDLQLSLEDDGESTLTVDLSGFLDNTDAQTLSISNDTLKILNGNSVGLNSYLDNTDSQQLTLSDDSLHLDNSSSVDLSTITPSTLADADGDTKIQAEEDTDEDIIRFDVDGTQAMVIDNNGYVGIGAEPTDHFQVKMGLSAVATVSPSNTSGNYYFPGTTFSWQSYTATVSGELEKVQLAFFYGTGARTISIYEGEGTAGALLGSTTVDPDSLHAWVDIPLAGIAQEAGQVYTISFDDRSRIFFDDSDVYAGGRTEESADRDYRFKVYVYSNSLFSVGENGVIIGEYELPNDDGANGQALITDGSGNADWADLSSYLDNTDEQTLSLSSDLLSISNGNSVDLSGYLDNTDDQTLSLSNDTLSINNGNSVDLSGYLDDMDEQELSLSNDTLTISSGNSVVLGLDHVSDDDADTKIQVEESLDEDFIRFDVAGSQAMLIDNDGKVGINVTPTDRFQVKMGLNPVATISAANSTGNIVSPSTGDSWQSYTATVTGEMEKVELDFLYGTGVRTISIYEGEGIAGTLLGSTTVDPDSINGFVDIPLAGIAQETGQVYTIAFDNRSRIVFDNSDVYPGGRTEETADRDYNFKVHVFSNSLFSVGENGVIIGGYSLPTDDGSNGQILSTDGSGTLSWANSLGNHTATQNIQLNGNWLSNDGSNEGLSIDNSGKVTFNKTIEAADRIDLNNGSQEFYLIANESQSYIQLDVGGSGHSSDKIILGDLTAQVNEVIMLGDVAIGVGAPSQKLTVGSTGDGTKAIANQWDTWSDQRLKRDFQEINDPIQKLNAINGYYYYWTEEKADQSRQVGVIAQEIETVLPELVTENGNGYKSVDYNKLVALLIEVNQVQQKEIETLKKKVNKISQLEEQTAEMKAMLEQIQVQMANSN